jgi:hypothetical protein
VKAFFSQNKKYTRRPEEHLKVFEENDIFHRVANEASNLFLTLLRGKIYSIKVANLSGYQKAWFVDKFIYTPFLRGAYFKKKLFNQMFRDNKLVVDRFYKTHLH